MDDATTLDTDRPHQTFQLKPKKFNNFGTTTLPEYFQQNVHIWTSCSPIWIDFLSANSLPLQGNNIVLFGQKPRRVAGFFFFCSLFAEVTRQSATWNIPALCPSTFSWALPLAPACHCVQVAGSTRCTGDWLFLSCPRGWAHPPSGCFGRLSITSLIGRLVARMWLTLVPHPRAWWIISIGMLQQPSFIASNQSLTDWITNETWKSLLIFSARRLATDGTLSHSAKMAHGHTNPLCRVLDAEQAVKVTQPRALLTCVALYSPDFLQRVKWSQRSTFGQLNRIISAAEQHVALWISYGAITFDSKDLSRCCRKHSAHLSIFSSPQPKLNRAIRIDCVHTFDDLSDFSKKNFKWRNYSIWLGTNKRSVDFSTPTPTCSSFQPQPGSRSSKKKKNAMPNGGHLFFLLISNINSN